jgi:Carboxypeptidase regulatory-like domain
LRTLRILPLLLAAITLAMPLAAQDIDAPKPLAKTGHITGTVTDVNDGVVPGATVLLEGPTLGEPRKVVSNDNGYFDFSNLDSGTYNVSIRAEGFANWTSSTVVVAPGQYVILTGSRLKISELRTMVSVVYSPEKVATEQVKAEEQQRVFGFIPNFYVVYDRNPEPMTTKLKFHLALKTSFDPVTVVGAAGLAAINQAGDTPNYIQGWKGYGERYGATAADGVSNIMIGGAMLPSLLHQDPRYYYQGTGSNKSRALHALVSPFICRGDNGRLQPNYSSLGGDLASSALSNAYYPPSNRGAGLVFENVALSTSERMLSTLVQEFLLHKLTPRLNK